MINKFNFHFYTNLCSKQTHQLLFDKYKVTDVNAAQNFFSLIAYGLKFNTEKAVTVNGILPINSNKQSKLLWIFRSEREDGIQYNYIPLVNLPLIKNIFLVFYLFFQILFKKNVSKHNDIIILDYLRFSINLPVTLACKIRGIKTLVIVTDNPVEHIYKNTVMSRLRNLLIFFLEYDFYVCVTDDLNSVVNKKKMPSRVIECFSNVKFRDLNNLINEKYKERVIIYAGGLFERYGIKNLINGFKMIKETNVKLWLFGVGSFVEEICESSNLDSRIQYKGVITNDELTKILIKATLLINPRPSHEEYTKYSFPSKNMEYMSVGTPLVTTRLPGIPSDHIPFIYIIDDETEIGIFKTLSSLLQKSDEELNQFGLICKDYTLREKNNIIQTGKIIKMVNS